MHCDILAGQKQVDPFIGQQHRALDAVVAQRLV